MKLVKFVFRLAIWVIVLALAVVLTLPMWIGPAAKLVANAAGQKMQVAVAVDDFALNPYIGELRIEGFQVANPAGFSKPDAVKLGTLEVSLDPLSLAGDVIHVRLVRLNGLYVSYLSENGRINLDVLMAKAKGEGTGAKDEVSKDEEAQDETPAAERGTAKPRKRVIIDHLEIGGVAVQLGPVPLPVPPLELNDIGKKSHGATFEEAWNQIFESVMKSSGISTEGLKSLSGALGDQTLAPLGKHANKLNDAAGKFSKDAVGEGAKKAIDSLKRLW